MAARPRILIAGPDPDVACLEERLEGLGYAVCAAVRCGRRAVEEAGRQRPALALIDVGLAGAVSGLDAAGQSGSRFDVPVVFLIGEDSERLLPAARAIEPFGYVWKPFADRQLQLILDNARSVRAREAALRERARRLEHDIVELRDDAQLFHTVFDAISDGVVASGSDDRHRLIFTAGYTTKKEGSGLGLHSAANFVIASGGKIYPLSGGIGKGTTMRVMLRRSSTLPEDAPSARTGAATAVAGNGGNGRLP